MEPVDLVSTDDHLIATITLPDEAFKHVRVRKIGHVLHVEVERQGVDKPESTDPYARVLARREPHTPPVLRRAIPLEQVTEEPVWHVTDDNRLTIEMRLYGASRDGRDQVIDVELPPSGPQPAKVSPTREPRQRSTRS